MTCLPFDTRYTCAVSKDRPGSAPAAASAYFTDSSYVRTILRLVNKQMGLTPRGLPIPCNRNRSPARPRFPILVDLSNALCHNPGCRKLLRAFLCLLSIGRLAQNPNRVPDAAGCERPPASPTKPSESTAATATWPLGVRRLVRHEPQRSAWLSNLRGSISSSFGSRAPKGWYPPPRSS